MKENLSNLLQRPDIWQGSRGVTPAAPTLASGHAQLDAQLHGGGWPSQGVTEILLPQSGIGELQLLLPVLAQLSHQPRWLAWVAPPYLPYAPALVAGGVQLERMLLVQPPAARDGWWAVEQAARSGACSVVMSWLPDAHDKIQRRLQLAAETGNTWVVVFRPSEAVAQPSYAALRIVVTSTPEGLNVRILKQRSVRPSAAPILLRRH